MDCDDQVGLVKGNDNPHPLTPDAPDISPIAMRVQIHILRMRNQLFRIGNRRADIASLLFACRVKRT